MSNVDWPLIVSALKDRVGAGAYKNWIEPLRLLDVKNQVAQIEVSTNFIGDYVQRSFGDYLLREFAAHNVDVQRLEFITKSKDQAASATPLPNSKTQQGSKPTALGAKKQSGSALNKKFNFDSFVVGASNELAYIAARHVSTGQHINFNPLFIHSAVGLGKTHLMHAIAWEAQANNPNANVYYLSAEHFMFTFVQALRNKDTHSFKEMLRNVDILMVDDIQFIVGKDSTQEEFFHTFNALVDQGKQIVISGNRAPFDMDSLDERIKSRLQMGLVVDVQPADYDLRLGILQLKARACQKRHPNVIIEDGVLEFMAQRICANTRVLEGALNRLFAFGAMVDQPVSQAMCEELVRDILRATDRKIALDEIIRSVGDYYGVSLTDLISARRSRSIARPRQVAMFLCKKLTTKSLPEIGRSFGKRDHTTVIHAIKKINELQEVDVQIAKDLNLLQQNLKN